MFLSRDMIITVKLLESKGFFLGHVNLAIICHKSRFKKSRSGSGVAKNRISSSSNRFI